MTNTAETNNRLNKAEAVATVLREVDVQAADLVNLPEAAWRLASMEAARRLGKDWQTCSGDTRGVVAWLMRRHEEQVEETPDPFAGFPKF
jgi:hypothetical protein